MSDVSPLSGEERKSNFGAAKSVEDPDRTLVIARHATKGTTSPAEIPLTNSSQGSLGQTNAQNKTARLIFFRFQAALASCSRLLFSNRRLMINCKTANPNDLS